jgi:hypothetical protein
LLASELKAPEKFMADVYLAEFENLSEKVLEKLVF